MKGAVARTEEIGAGGALRLLSFAHAMRRARLFCGAFVALLLCLAVGVAVYAFVGSLFLRLWRIPAIFLLCALITLALSSLVLYLLERLYGRAREVQNRTMYINVYVRSLLREAYDRYAIGFREMACGDMLEGFARQYAGQYTVQPSEYPLFSSRRRAMAAGKEILARYESLLRDLSDEARAGMIVRLLKKVQGALDKWCTLCLSEYAEPQKDLILENVRRLMQTVADRREELLCAGGENYFDLAGSVSKYKAPHDAAAPRPLPHRDEYLRFCTVVKSIKAYDSFYKNLFSREGATEEYRALLAEYETFVARYSTAGCETVDLAACRKKLETVLSYATRCWNCEKEYNPRFHQTCAHCGHVICKECGRCYCGRQITHRGRGYGRSE